MPNKEPARARLGRSDWVMAGFRALVAAGPEAIKVEPIARDIGATKGSFYWHFKTLRELHAAMLEAWELLATTEITGSVRRAALSPRDRVLLLVDLVSAVPQDEVGGMAVEPALRDWGRTAPLARAVLQRVDAQRLADLRAFFADAGLDSAAAAEGAVRFYAAVIGLENLRITCGVEMRPALRSVAVSILDGVE